MGRDEFEVRLQTYVDQIMQYYDPAKQELARALLPVDEFEENAAIALAKEGNFDPTKEERDHYLLLQLLFWFKKTFSWVNAPPCNFCAAKTQHIGMGAPTAEDLQFGAGRVEVYCCELCGTITRFPRYNDPAKLMETQCGRCGEWANCFTFCCIALGYNARLVLDFTDHVWTECYSHYLGRWMHLDPCEASYDKPLLYEKGWGKKLSYVIALAEDGVYDVTKRYTREWPQVLSRRNMVNEDDAEEVITFLTAVQRSKLPPEELDVLELHDKQESEEILREHTFSTVENLPGRQSGSEEWRKARGEMGIHQCARSSHNTCPARICVDEHVGKVYKAIGLTDITKFMAVRSLLLKLKKEPFKTRQLSVSSEEDIQTVHSAAALLDAIGLETKDNGGLIEVKMKDSPINVALALEVACENIETNRSIDNLEENSLQLMFEGRRICGGTVYATGEELPTGIARAAFDGLYSTKWEEPEGAKGAYMYYHLPQNIPQRVIGYDLTSANDCPERDPSDWVLEGSSDGGETWHCLDKRAGEIFEKRFERRCFKIPVESQVSCNVLRLEFKQARDATRQSRLQLSCIDFYGD